MNRYTLLSIFLILSTLQVVAQEPEPKKQPFILKGLYWVKTLIDSSAVSGVDRSYIEQPKRPWAVEVRTDASETTLKMHTDVDFGNDVMGNMRAVTRNGFSTSLGAWIGYRGYGVGWSKELTGGDGTTFSLGATGGSFGINLRINSFRSRMPEFTFTADNHGQPYKERFHDEIDDPIKVRSLFIDGYYLFNRKHFSYAAAYDQSLIQRRSAGSLMAGAMYHHCSADYSADSNWGWVYYMKGVGKLKFTQANIGVGYAYNWVPARGWLVNILAMPTLALYNRTTLYEYTIYYDSDKETVEEALNDPDTIYELEEETTIKTPNKVTWNFDARLAVVYNWQRSYLRVYGHFNRFTYGSDVTWGRLYDWKVYAAFGYRF